MIRLYIDTSLSVGLSQDLSSDQAHYVNNVMRLKVGDEVAVFNGQDGEWLGQISSARKKNCTIQLIEKIREQDSCPDLMLVFAPIKKQRLDFIMEKATELGVSDFQPVITQRTIASKIRSDRLCAQTIEASEQCERLNIPVVHEAVSLVQLVKDWPQERTLFVLNEHGGAKPILEGLQEFAGKEIGPCAILVGPEGGFDPSELDLLAKLQNVVPLSIGPRILRADTAALAAISCWQSVLGDWQVPLRKRFEKEE
ncbi:16S rRNA (uracil(1498)-N(3))-methyltransferase [Terasakiella sp. SH-1]|uniref:16S rRNA (uracil(1498)-N(3))-methyltransferase n=1 Tax=Terasakiella sp. SH-1 TaxID=2560057 RepID=UPI0010745A2F|nr:16S rRNA (uracil(1498)-N(3))-methyltransferase [Terasakiella sp. SH-1]